MAGTLRAGFVGERRRPDASGSTSTHAILRVEGVARKNWPPPIEHNRQGMYEFFLLNKHGTAQ